ncbi:MAG: leucine-rich repeat protein [Clostridia bacterium]|nr:leucine-rich repeat protein [Clostridia bacterium]
MRPHPKTIIITLAIGIAMAFAFAVALLCVPQLNKEPPHEDTTARFTSETADTAPPSIESETAPPPMGNGLRFSSNGDGTCVLSGIGDCTDASIVIPEFSPAGERVTEIATMAFYRCETVTAVQIPPSITAIGRLAFADCKNLAYIAVNTANSVYRDVDGVLYSADLTALYLYPPMRAGTGATIPVLTKRIDDMAFYRCANLSHVTYEGTPEQWESISIGSQNYSLTAASKSFQE